MTLTEIIENELDIFESAKAFRHDANELMFGLSTDFSFSLEASEPFGQKVYSHKHNNKGQFRNEWTFFFHGAECKFENLKTGQVVELIYATKPEFGFLDGYFLFNYLNSTNRYKKLAALLMNGSNTWTAIEALADKGILTRDTSVTINRNIIALSKNGIQHGVFCYAG